MMNSSDFNVQMQQNEPIKLIHEYSATEYYIGISSNGNDTSSPIWQIKRSKKEGNVWSLTEFPNGIQSFSFIWNDRLTYTYK